MKIPRNTWLSVGVTDTGNIRERNEDAFLTCNKQKLWAVADGMGGHDAGDVASQMVIRHLQQYQATPLLGRNVRQITRLLQSTNKRLILKALSTNKNIIGSTVCALLAHRKHCVFLWAGDSRIYRLRDGHFQQITQDHSESEELIKAGMTREDVSRLPHSEAITRAVGSDTHLNLEISMRAFEQGDTYLLCSDGLYKELSERDIANSISTHSLDECVNQLLDKALQRQARDNITIVEVQAPRQGIEA
jgi:protein phosphatase